MPVTALSAAALVHNKAQDASVGGSAADTVNFNSVPNNGLTTIVIIQCGATPGTVSVSFSAGVDGSVPADLPILDQAGAALQANHTYVWALGSVAAYGNPATIKATQATTKFTVLNVGVA